MIYIFWSCQNKEEAKKVINHLLEKRFIACASIFPVESFYLWKGNIAQGEEVKVVFKTEKSLYSSVEKEILLFCSYEVPEIIQIDVSQGYKPYLSWIAQETTAL